MLYYIRCEPSQLESARTALVASGVEERYMDVSEALKQIVISTEDSHDHVLSRLRDSGAIENYLPAGEMPKVSEEVQVNEMEGK